MTNHLHVPVPNPGCTKPLWSSHACARVGCGNLSAIALRINSSTVMPLCAACEARRQRGISRDGDAGISVDRRRLAFYPE
jgi:hypothetical protein